MTKQFKQINQDHNQFIAKLGKDIPEVMKAFGTLHHSATQEGALSKKTKELIATALAVAGHCDGCIGHHVQSLVKLNVSRAELTEMLGVAILMGGGPSLMYAAEALSAYEELGS